MPASENSKRAFKTTSSTCSRPTAAKAGAAELELIVGLALCASTQIEHAADSVRVACLWVDSAAAVHAIRDRQSQADHRTQRVILLLFDFLLRD